MAQPLLKATDRGVYCPAGKFYIDPWAPVEHAIITHAHTDHARWGCQKYLATPTGTLVLEARFGASFRGRTQALAYGEPLDIHGVRVSLHPAGHVLGSAMVRVEHKGQVWVASGDYKTDRDGISEPWEPVKCHTFITESTFGLPIFRWRPPHELNDDLNTWWRANAAAGRTSAVFGYSLGKAQRLIAAADPSIGPIFIHGAMTKTTEAYRAAGVALPPTAHADRDAVRAAAGRALVIAPPITLGSPWLRKFGDISTAFASGWMQVRGTRRRRNVDRGFVLSDHADWPGLLHAIKESGATSIGVTHGSVGTLVRYLCEMSLNAWALPTRYVGEAADEDATEAEASLTTEQPTLESANGDAAAEKGRP